MIEICSFFDRHYLGRALALYSSLRAHCPESRLWALCLDEASFAILARLELPGVHALPLATLEAADPELQRVRGTRTLLEYYFTITPSFLLYLINRLPANSLLAYSDADTFYFGSIEAALDELGKASVGIVEHRFDESGADLLARGRFNSGWLACRSNPEAEVCLRWWRAECLAWCHERMEGNRYASQKYLDEWPGRFPGVAVLKNKGLNLAPWNLGRHVVAWDGARVLVDGDPLVFYHFHGLRRVAPRIYHPGLSGYGVKASRVVREHIYAPYVRALGHAARKSGLSSVPDLTEGLRTRPLSGRSRVMNSLRDAKRLFTGENLILPD